MSLRIADFTLRQTKEALQPANGAIEQLQEAMQQHITKFWREAPSAALRHATLSGLWTCNMPPARS